MRFVVEGLADEVGGVSMARRSSAYNRGMKPGSIAVPPVTRIEAASVLRRSTGTYGEMSTACYNGKRMVAAPSIVFRG